MAAIRFDSKGERLFKGERERKDGRYEYRYTNCKGEKCSIYSGRLQSLRIEEAKIAYKEQMFILNGIKEVTLNDMFEIWFAGKVALKETTLRGYRQTYDSFVRNSIGKMFIDEIKTVDIKSFYLRLKTSRSISTETICRIQNILFQIFQTAMDSDVIWKNPADRATKEIKRSHPKHSSTREGVCEETADRLTDYILRNSEFCKWYPTIYIMIHTGLRLGELISLRWCDVNLSKKYIDVNHNVSYYAREGEKARYHFSDSTKTYDGLRRIPFDSKVKKAFEMEKAILEHNNVTCKQEIDGYNDFVFLNRFGKMYDQRAINKALERIVGEYNFMIERQGLEEELQIPHLSSHSLRHTYAIILCERNVNIKVMQMLLGHKDISTTMDIYTKISKKFMLDEYVRKMGE